MQLTVQSQEVKRRVERMQEVVLEVGQIENGGWHSTGIETTTTTTGETQFMKKLFDASRFI